MDTLKSRMQNFAESHNLSIHAMELRANVATSTIAKAVNGMYTTNLAKILDAFPDMDARAILGCVPYEESGIPMKVSIPKDNSFDEEWYKSQIEEKDRQIASLLRILEKGEREVSQSINL